jgi:formylmethanofuran dehydrogenase subunit E
MTEKPPICDECKKEVPLFDHFVKHKDGRLLCMKCFDAKVKSGEI